MLVNWPLGLGNEMIFLQQALSADRLPPIGSYTNIQTNWHFYHRDPQPPGDGGSRAKLTGCTAKSRDHQPD